VRERVDSLLGSTIESRLARPFQVKGTIVPSEGRVELRLETNDNGLPGSRTITGASCDELSSAGALVIALAIDPAAVAAHGGAPSAAFGADAPAPRPPAAAPPAASPSPAPAPAWQPPSGAPRPTESNSKVRGVTGLKMIADFGSVSSGPAIGADIGAGFLIGRFLLRLDAKYFPPRFSAADGAPAKGADISLIASSLSGCFVSRSGRLGFGACAEIEAGAFLAKGTGLVDNSSAANPWVAPGLGAELSVDLADPLCLLVGLGALVPIGREGRPSVQYLPAQGTDPERIFQPSPVVGRAGVGLGVALE
jgi:hypothetical protein